MHTVWLPTGDELNPGHGRHISVLLRKELKCSGGQAKDKVKRKEGSEVTKGNTSINRANRKNK